MVWRFILKIETKFDIGQTVFYMSENKITQNNVKHIEIEVSKNPYISYSLGTLCMVEEDLFATKEDLIKELYESS